MSNGKYCVTYLLLFSIFATFQYSVKYETPRSVFDILIDIFIYFCLAGDKLSLN